MTLQNAIGEDANLTLNNYMVNCIDDGDKVDVVNFDPASLELDATVPLGRLSEVVNVGVLMMLWLLWVPRIPLVLFMMGLWLGRLLVLLLLLEMKCLLVLLLLTLLLCLL
ncbi:hypothetical protein MA16_Dca001235 [Dendrobium catenatum]|uniref:Uncharacterized protein n=1 Tax=Dendrobium catenatum TaxID=906689 RepID=A0A2I0WLU4_9ASPA|nr:hypothetical protein MA16_Dca001235 [Dendrobium catenatum]